MRWISAVCLCVLAAQLVSSYPVDDIQSKQETLSTLEASLGKPTSEHSDREKRTIGVLRQIFPELSKESSRTKRAAPEDPQKEQSEKKEVRVPIVPDGNDLKAAASGDDAEEAESSKEEDVEEAESGENTRSKRLGVLGNLFGGSSSGSGSGSGGSGNFLFDIIRRTADGAARAAGTVYRIMAGTDNIEPLAYTNELQQDSMVAAATSPVVTTPTTAKPAPPPPPPPAPKTPTLVAGSGATEQQDENANAPLAPGDAAAAAPSDDGYQAGIPGPITRLFVIANRGIANLIQDLILRLAQTSERIVNFKARLITAII